MFGYCFEIMASASLVFSEAADAQIRQQFELLDKKALICRLVGASPPRQKLKDWIRTALSGEEALRKLIFVGRGIFILLRKPLPNPSFPDGLSPSDIGYYLQFLGIQILRYPHLMSCIMSRGFRQRFSFRTYQCSFECQQYSLSLVLYMALLFLIP